MIFHWKSRKNSWFSYLFIEILNYRFANICHIVFQYKKHRKTNDGPLKIEPRFWRVDFSWSNFGARPCNFRKHHFKNEAFEHVYFRFQMDLSPKDNILRSPGKKKRSWFRRILILRSFLFVKIRPTCQFFHDIIW